MKNNDICYTANEHAFDVIKDGKVIFSNFSYNEACKLSDTYGGLVSRKLKDESDYGE